MIPGQGTRSHILQLRVCVLQLRPGAAKTHTHTHTHTHLSKGLGKEGSLGRTLREGNGECLSPSSGLQVGTSISWGEDGRQLVWTGAEEDM